jgi:hypothetical protein
MVQGDQNAEKKCMANNTEAIQFYTLKIGVAQQPYTGYKAHQVSWKSKTQMLFACWNYPEESRGAPSTSIGG